MQYIVGIDEAGRGPLAGPVAVGVVVVADGFDWNLLPGVNDSKKLTATKRETIYKRTKELRKKGKLTFAVGQVSAAQIDKIGITKAVQLAMNRCISRLEINPKNTYIKLDGSLKAPVEFKQETIIKGDSKEKCIGLASICAKVTRDEYMMKQAKKYPEYGFEQHMGYGTKLHREKIAECGYSRIHRVSYCQNIVLVVH